MGYGYLSDIDHKVASYLTEDWIQHLNFYSTRFDRMGMTLGDVKIASLLDQTMKVEWQDGIKLIVNLLKYCSLILFIAYELIILRTVLS